MNKEKIVQMYDIQTMTRMNKEQKVMMMMMMMMMMTKNQERYLCYTISKYLYSKSLIFLLCCT